MNSSDEVLRGTNYTYIEWFVPFLLVFLDIYYKISLELVPSICMFISEMQSKKSFKFKFLKGCFKSFLQIISYRTYHKILCVGGPVMKFAYLRMYISAMTVMKFLCEAGEICYTFRVFIEFS